MNLEPYFKSASEEYVKSGGSLKSAVAVVVRMMLQEQAMLEETMADILVCAIEAEREECANICDSLSDMIDCDCGCGMRKPNSAHGVGAFKCATAIRQWRKDVIPEVEAVPKGYKILKDTTHEERSFPEDGTYENGCYYNNCVNCGRMFTGHKRRVICKVCDDGL